MSRPLHQIRTFRMVLSLLVALGLGTSRTEKLWAEALQSLHPIHAVLSAPHADHDPFDPRRVPQSGGATSRLLAGFPVKPLA